MATSLIPQIITGEENTLTHREWDSLGDSRLIYLKPNLILTSTTELVHSFLRIHPSVNLKKMLQCILEVCESTVPRSYAEWSGVMENKLYLP